MTNIVTREEAKLSQLTRYFTGVPCVKYAHVGERLTSSGECVECKRLRERQKYISGDTGHKNYYKNNRERMLAVQKAADDKRRSEKIEYGRIWRTLNREYAKMYRSRHADLYRFHSAKRRAWLYQVTPSWANEELMRKLYQLADQLTKETGIPHEVDHIVPLQHKLVCGLHTHDNLQILTSTENRSKKNAFECS